MALGSPSCSSLVTAPSISRGSSSLAIQVSASYGLSGQPASPFYGNLLPLWAEDGYFPLVFSAARVDAETTNTLVLEP